MPLHQGDTALLSSEIAPVVCPACTVRITSTPGFPHVGRTGSIICARCQTGSRRKRSKAVFTAMPAPGSANKETTVPAMSGQAGLLMLSRLSHAASSQQPAASSQPPTSSSRPRRVHRGACLPIKQASLQRMPSVVDRLFNVYMLVSSRLGWLQYNLTTHHICRSLSMTQSTSITALYCIGTPPPRRSGI